MTGDFVVTPWEVRGEVDYDKLVSRFGTSYITADLIRRIPGGENNIFLQRKIFYSHRDLDWILLNYEKGKRFYLYTGRGPSSGTHIGHMIPWIFTRQMQEAFNSKLYFQMTDDEKFLFKENLTLEDTRKSTFDNILDFIALGFDPARTKIVIDTKDISLLYRTALKVSKRVTFSTAKAVFGFDNSTNIGSIFFTSIQSVPAFLESELKGENVPCLIPCGIDQDPHFRVTRDVAPALGYFKPALIHCKMLPGLTGGKMSSTGEAAIYTTDTDAAITKKIMNAFTGGRATVEEQRRLGANPDICPVYHHYEFLFEPDPAKLKKIEEDCRSGALLCGDCKANLLSKVKLFMTQHRKNRERASEIVDDFMLSAKGLEEG
ncbi:MAG: tryptophan--tRNA ligase [Candidatus Thermoplasmatota archaeon]|jgi:tryptophanyl-tRNA synthetase|nr:tryptophan--tRNA ligase [Candidatus Sysuiplasma jiujiangense]MBX8639402.1 tryptophan--tRNA ligase [Candidatus Sysuiplasma jiujiangense]MBX8642376.1 tryptophan--tRNA ligase [Candidatus Sysuiplasma jiujiangense]MCL4317610.1 tryptophan--tRNA ligase [Candidatus Thermoplasmatota archaeon]